MIPKFRAWDGDYKKMLDVDSIDFKYQTAWLSWHDDDVNQGAYELPIKDLKLMQYTGFKDKNRKEIFDGDIVKHGVWNDIDRVEIVGRGFLLVPIMDWDEEYINECEIIGNIYENPELMEEID